MIQEFAAHSGLLDVIKVLATNKCFHRGLRARDALLKYLDNNPELVPKTFFSSQKPRIEPLRIPPS
ncbi:MAG: hypothetical protein HY074_11395 [Deltaproteobacteria bacterium]|nr:hypothetical protein [Deltaproteobacteria bacterium]